MSGIYYHQIDLPDQILIKKTYLVQHCLIIEFNFFIFYKRSCTNTHHPGGEFMVVGPGFNRISFGSTGIASFLLRKYVPKVRTLFVCHFFYPFYILFSSSKTFSFKAGVTKKYTVKPLMLAVIYHGFLREFYIRIG